MIRWLRLAAGLLLLGAAAYSVSQTIDILKSRRLRRIELAEIGHIRYGLLNADVWVEKIVPVLNTQIDSLDLTANGAALRPTVIKALNNLIDQVKNQLSPPPKPDAPKPTGAAALLTYRNSARRTGSPSTATPAMWSTRSLRIGGV